jgi:cytochrome P450
MPQHFDDEGKVDVFSDDFARCPQEVYREMRARCPVARSQLMNQPIITRYDDVVWALRNPEIFSSQVDLQVALGTERPMIPQQLDPPAQTRYRRLLDPHFSRKKMELLIPGIRAEANRLIDTFIDRGRCDFDPDFAVPLPCTAFLQLLGLPPDRLDFFLEIKDGIIRPQVQRPDLTDFEDLKQVRVDAGQRMYRYFGEVIDERRGEPAADLLSALLEGEIDGERLSETELLDICFLLLLAGLDTVTATLGCNLAYLAANPEQRERIVADPAQIPGAIEELMRWETPVTSVPRVVKRDVEVGGVMLREGEMVSILLGSANTDETHFEDPTHVDFARERNVHTAFGVGPHRCLGSHLARMELQVAMEEWHRRIPSYRIPEGEVPRYSAGIREVLYLPLEWDVA